MRALICTGNSGEGSALLAAATASTAARGGTRTLLTSIGPSHRLAALVGTPLSNEPRQLAPNLAAYLVDAPADLSAFLEHIRPNLPSQLKQLSGDELPLVPGIDFFLSLERLRHTAAAGYDLAVIDAGPHDTLLRVAALPDSVRWLVRLLIGLDRGPGGNMASLNQALVPTSLLPAEWLAPIQDGRMQFEAIRDRAFAASGTSVRYVVRPDVMGLNEARLAVPALQLHGLAVDSLVTGPLLPDDSSDTRLHPLIEQQQQIGAEVARIWAPRPVLALPLTRPPRQVDDLAALGQAIYGSRASSAAERLHDSPAPIVHGDRSDPSLTIHLPGITRETLSLTVSGDELIVRIGPYRRHILLPAALRNVPNIKASRDGERLIVRLRQQ